MSVTARSELSIAYQPLCDVKNNPRNARTHSKHQIRQIADSIREFGFTNPVLLDTTNTIIAGHGRVAAAKLLGISKVPTIRLENLTPEQIRAYMLADNRLAEKAGWDKSILAIELQHLLTIDNDFEVTITGFDIPEIDLILQDVGSNDDRDDVVEIGDIGTAICQPGDIWMLGKHRLSCGNALRRSSYAELMANRRAAAVFVDPPYNVPIDGHVSGNGSVRHREFQMASGDMSEAEFVSFLTTSLRLLAQYSTSGSVHFICMDW